MVANKTTHNSLDVLSTSLAPPSPYLCPRVTGGLADAACRRSGTCVCHSYPRRRIGHIARATMIADRYASLASRRSAEGSSQVSVAAPWYNRPRDLAIVGQGKCPVPDCSEEHVNMRDHSHFITGKVCRRSEYLNFLPMSSELDTIAISEENSQMYHKCASRQLTSATLIPRFRPEDPVR